MIKPGQENDQQRETLGLYVHVPFCLAKCGYCDFYSVPLASRNTDRLVTAIVTELHKRLRETDAWPRTAFVGGGTPTILPIAQFERLLAAVAACAGENGFDEFTVEANPATVDRQRADAMAERGATRVSIGAQSFIPSELAFLQRNHNPEDIDEVIAIVRASGIGRINLDLIFGIPGQTCDTWAYSLEHALSLGVDHLACYGLTYESGTRLTARRDVGLVSPCGETLEAELFSQASRQLTDAGFEHYEISNYTKRERCLHNLNYWQNGDYVGIGPSAAGTIAGRRYKNVADVDAYIDSIESTGLAEAESEAIAGEALMIEMIMMQLRLSEGLSTEAFARRCGVCPHRLFADACTSLVSRNLLQVSSSHIALTSQGRLVADRVIAELVESL